MDAFARVAVLLEARGVVAPLMVWLRKRVWPMEAAHTPASLRAATRLATTELLLSGTTSVLTMETVHDTDAVFEAAAESGRVISACEPGRRIRTRRPRKRNAGRAAPFLRDTGCASSADQLQWWVVRRP